MESADQAGLLEKAKRGDKRAFEALLVPHLPMLLAYSQAICRDFQTAQDVVQETALVAYRNLERFFPDADFAGWLKAIARRQGLAARRDQGRVAQVPDEIIEAAYADPSPEAVAPERQALRRCLEALDARGRQLIDARYVRRTGLAAVAAELGTNVNTIRWQIFRLRQRLKECVQRKLAEAKAP